MTSKQNDVKEIDLIELFSIIGKGIKRMIISLIKAFLFLIVFGVKRIHFLILFVIAGGVIGLIFFNSTQRFYSSDLIAQPNGISSVDMVDYINDLTALCKTGNKKGLARSLKLPDSTAIKIKDIKAFHYIDINNDKVGDFIDFDKNFNAIDTTKKIVKDRIYLQVDVFDNNAFEEVRIGIFNYIANNPYLIKLNELRKKELKELISQTNIEINKLDSLQNVDYFNNKSSLSASNDNRLMFLSEKDKQLYYRDKLNLIEKKQEYIKELELATAPITIIKDFTQLAVAENPKGEYIIKFGFWFGMIGYIILLVFKYRKNVLELIKE